MKTSYWFLAIIAILMYNGALVRRDQQLFQKHDHDMHERACVNVKTFNPNCIYEK